LPCQNRERIGMHQNPSNRAFVLLLGHKP
jgi:hypothetical protein